MHIFKIPAALVSLGVSEVGLVELNMDEELTAIKRAHGDAVRLAYEYTKECVRFIDGQPVRTMDGSVDKALATMHPKIRALVMQGYGILHQPKDEENAAFQASHEVRVG